jgi:gliding motility-associated-like protein
MKKLYHLLFVLLLLVVWSGNAQTTFRKSYDVASFDIAGGMVESPLGGFAIAGTNSDFIPFFGNVIRTDAAGNITWAKSFTGGIASSFLDIKNVSTGGFIACGETSNGGAVLVRIDDLGNLIWAKRYQCPDLSGKPSYEYASAVIETSDGGFAVAGGVNYFWDGSSASTIDTTSALAFKVDANGVLQWNRVWTFPTANPDEHYFTDLTETADGIYLVGQTSEGTGTLNDNGDYPSNALLVKVNKTTGVTTFINRWGASGTSEGINSCITLSTGNVLMGGFDGDRAFLLRISGAGSSYAHQWGRRIDNNVVFFIPQDIYLIQDIMETSDGNYAFTGSRIDLFNFPSFQTVVAKFNPTTNAQVFMKGYQSIGLSSILPEGGLTSDQGFHVIMTDQQMTGFNYNIIRTNNIGEIGSATTGCGHVTLNPATSNYNPTVNTITNNQFVSLSETTYTPIITNLTPTEVVHCLVTACTAPTAPTTVTATPATICAGESSVIDVTSPVSGVTYNVYTAITGGTNLGAVPHTVSPASTTTYYVEAVNSSDPTCVSTTRTPITVTVNPAPTATAGGGGNVCTGGTINLTATTVTGATYGWTGPNVFSSPNQNPTISNATLAMSGTYTLTVTLNGCSATSTVNITVGDPPQATASSNSPVCVGQQIELFGQTTTGTHSWTGPSFTSSIQNPVIGNATAANAGTYTYTYTENGCTSLPATITVVVNPAPTPTATGNSPVCSGGTIELSATGGSSYSWSGPNSYSGTGASVNIPNVTTDFSGPFTVTATDENGCTATATVLMNVTNGPSVNVIGTNVLCNGGTSGQAIANPTGTGPFTYSWSPSGQTNQTAENLSAGVHTVTVIDGNNCSTVASTTLTQPAAMVLNTSTTASSCTAPTGSASVSVTGGAGSFTYNWSPLGGNGNTTTPISAGTYIVTVIDANLCQASATVNVPSVNGPSVTISGLTDATCFGSANGSATAIASLGTPGYTYQWSPSGGTDATASGLTAGTYAVQVTDAAGCITTETVVIGQPTQIILNETVTSATCGNTDGGISLAVTGGSGVYSYVWTPATITGSNASNIFGGSYSVVVTDDQGCSTTQIIVVGVSGSLNVDVTPNFAEIVQGESVDLTTVVVPSNAGNTYTWTPITDLSCSDCPNPTATPNETTLYTVTVTAPDGCMGSDTALIVVEMLCGDFFLPNIFSPNGDGLNDELCLLGNCIAEFHLKIFDRWGELVFETKDQNVCWDGTYNGKIMNTASFVYVLDLRTFAGAEINRSGNLSLVR